MLWRKLKVTEVEWGNDEGGIIWEGFWTDGLYAEIRIFRRKPTSKYLKKEQSAFEFRIPRFQPTADAEPVHVEGSLYQAILYKGLAHMWILVWGEGLEPIPHGYQGATVLQTEAQQVHRQQRRIGFESSAFSVRPKLGTEETIPRKDVSKVGRDGSCRVWQALGWELGVILSAVRK